MSRTAPSVRQHRARIVLRVLKRLYPNPACFLHYRTQWEFLVAVVLSAQCTDKKVNEVTEKLFKKYKTLDAYIDARPQEFEQDIFQTGFYRSKAKHILAAVKKLAKDFKGKVPRTAAELISLPGVGRKTANVVLGELFNIAEGIAVDTHVIRLANKFGLTSSRNPRVIERELMTVMPKKEWIAFTHRMIVYGREHSTARKVKNTEDPISIALKKYFFSL